MGRRNKIGHKAAFNVSFGEHTFLHGNYVKDQAVSIAGDDTVWIDNIIFSSNIL